MRRTLRPALRPPLRRSLRATDDELRAALNRVRTEVGKAVVGQDGAVTGLIIALLARGHVLLEGVPGVAKTLLVRTLSRALRLDTRRRAVHPRPHARRRHRLARLRPAAGEFAFREGPVFTNILLADEINRTPPKTQSALLEAMEERQVSADGVTRPLPEPFMVAATQNPIEYEGTYSLPEAQLDRFLLKLVLDVPERDAEIVGAASPRRRLQPARPRRGRRRRRCSAPPSSPRRRPRHPRSRVEDDVLGYLVDLARATRRSPSMRLGVSPRGTTGLLAAAKAWAWLTGYDVAHARPRAGDGAARVAAPHPAAARGRARGRRRSTRCCGRSCSRSRFRSEMARI